MYSPSLLRVCLVALGFSLLLPVACPAASSRPKSIHQPETTLVSTLAASGLTFTVMTYRVGRTSYVMIRTEGLKERSSPIRLPLEGRILGVESADLNEDGFAEIYVFIQSERQGAVGSMIAYASNMNRTLSPIVLQDIHENSEASQGYRGYDTFRITDSRLERSIPVYKPEDSVFSAHGGERVLRYRLVPGEDGWQLVISRIEN